MVGRAGVGTIVSASAAYPRGDRADEHPAQHREERLHNRRVVTRETTLEAATQAAQVAVGVSESVLRVV